MIAHVEQLVEALRTELRQYGEMLALLDAAAPPGAPGLPLLLSSCESLQRQGAVIDDARQRRLQAIQRLAWAAGKTDCPALPSLLQELPHDYQPLVGALHDEIESLVSEVRTRAAAGQARLNVAAGDLERFITTLNHTGTGSSASFETPPHRAANA